jgi:beta-lactamase class A
LGASVVLALSVGLTAVYAYTDLHERVDGAYKAQDALAMALVRLGRNPASWQVPEVVRLAVQARESERLEKEQAAFNADIERFFQQKMDERRRLGYSGTIGLYVKELSTGYTYYQARDNNGPRTGVLFECASTVKLLAGFTLCYMNSLGQLDLNDTIKDDLLPYKGQILWTMRRMITNSVNEYFNVFLRFLGPKKINDTLKLAGLQDTTVRREILPSPEVTNAGVLARYGTLQGNYTSPRDFGLLLETLYRKQFLGGKNSELLLDIIQHTVYNSRIPTGINFEVPIAHKTGTAPGVVNDCALVFLPDNPYIIVMMSSGADAGVTLFEQQMARTVHDYMKARLMERKKGGYDDPAKQAVAADIEVLRAEQLAVPDVRLVPLPPEPEADAH